MLISAIHRSDWLIHTHTFFSLWFFFKRLLLIWTIFKVLIWISHSMASISWFFFNFLAARHVKSKLTNQRLNPLPSALEGEVSTTGFPGKFLHYGLSQDIEYRFLCYMYSRTLLFIYSLYPLYTRLYLLILNSHSIPLLSLLPLFNYKSVLYVCECLFQR